MSLPTVSVIFLSYKQERYVVEALRSVLNQDLLGYEVIVGDDDSPDGTRALIEAELLAYRGPARVTLMPQGPNLGIIGNMNRCVAASTGNILVVAAGDDVSHPARLRCVAEFFAAHPGCFAHYSNARVIDAEGQVTREAWYQHHEVEVRRFEPGSRHLYQGVRFCGATASYRRELFLRFGPMHRVNGGEDGPLVMRAILLGEVAVDSRTLMDWRWHGANMSHGSKPTNIGWREKLLRCAAWPAGQMEHLSGYLADIDHAEAHGLASPHVTRRLADLAREHHALACLKHRCTHPDMRWGQAWEAARAYWRASPRSALVRLRQVAKAFSKKLLPSRCRAALLFHASNF